MEAPISTAKLPANAERRQGILDLAVTIHDPADANFEERDVELLESMSPPRPAHPHCCISVFAPIRASLHVGRTQSPQNQRQSTRESCGLHAFRCTLPLLRLT